MTKDTEPIEDDERTATDEEVETAKRLEEELIRRKVLPLTDEEAPPEVVKKAVDLFPKKQKEGE